MPIRFTDELREAAAAWEGVVRHRFGTELASGIIDQRVMVRYLTQARIPRPAIGDAHAHPRPSERHAHTSQDLLFIDDLVVLFASMIAKAPTLADRIPACQARLLPRGP